MTEEDILEETLEEIEDYIRYARLSGIETRVILEEIKEILEGV